MKALWVINLKWTNGCEMFFKRAYKFYYFKNQLMLLIPLYAAGSDLLSLPAPLFFPPSTGGGGSGKMCRVPKHFPLFLKQLSPYSIF